MEERKIFRLTTILERIRTILDSHIKNKAFWLRMELADINFSKGHCYLELAETKEGKAIAQCKGFIWYDDIEMIRNNLGRDFNNVIKKGNEILGYVEVKFTVRFGLYIIIKDIDLNFSLGALEVKKQSTLKKLKEENVLNLNKRLVVPVVIQRIAIIGSQESAGIEDLRAQLEKNQYNYHFDIEFFHSHVQGEKAENEIVNRLNQLKKSNFDIIALVRGGGTKLDLEVFNSYNIAKEIALHDKPVFTGIGHETDLCVADSAANRYFKTPTALGSYIVDRAYNYEIEIKNLFSQINEYKSQYFKAKENQLTLNIQSISSAALNNYHLRKEAFYTSVNRINTGVKQLINDEKNRITVAKESIKANSFSSVTGLKDNLKHKMELIRTNSENKINRRIDKIEQNLEYILTSANKRCKTNRTLINNIRKVIKAFHPNNILNKGYAIPIFEGELLSDQVLSTHDIIEIKLKSRTLIVSFIKDK